MFSSNQLLRILPVLLLCVGVSACARQYSVTVNQQTLYDPRTRVATAAYFPDAGLQSCVNFIMRQQEITTVEGITILSCPNLEIQSLEGIRNLSNLQFLDLAGNELTHLNALPPLRHLSSVHAPDNALEDISALIRVRTLTSAVLTGNNSIPCHQLDELSERLGPDLIRPESCLE